MSKTEFTIAQANRRKRRQTRAAVRLCIEECLDKPPSVYTPELYRAKCDVVYQHVYDSYGGAEQCVYAQAGGAGAL